MTSFIIRTAHQIHYKLPRRKRRVVHVVRKEERRGANRVWVWICDEKKKTNVRPGRRWEDNIESALQEIGLGRGLDLAGSG